MTSFHSNPTGNENDDIMYLIILLLNITMNPTCIKSVVACLKVSSEPVKGERQRVSSYSQFGGFNVEAR